MFRRLMMLCVAWVVLGSVSVFGQLPFSTVFKGQKEFEALVARGEAWKALPLGERVAAVGKAMVGTPYKNFTLEIDDRIEAPSANFEAVDCWTFFEIALAFARMLEEPREKWTPQTLLHYIELDRYRGGSCDGTYLSRLHYLEEWLVDNSRRGLVKNMGPELGAVRVPHSAVEMTINWKSYRYLRNNPSLRSGIRKMEERVSGLGLAHIPEERVAKIESQLRTGDIIGITTHDSPRRYGTSHVGIAVRQKDGIHFMHASMPKNFGRVVLDAKLTDYLARYKSSAGIIVARPVR